ncbi:hypothetical protein Poli38472_010348 [Pythium oligandrum]|uniref:Glycoside hydrolase n=1 Tax=Pythium oligandrum TaxID=41045 RepID=A0A8K1C2W8_PYTOL|nr:hypothetical protein Poli38472_010348 [Pythium oligandrum]|eukprot:TMW55466.1 hypothetical protein Poli38472_010348 [Pythium oligandrum]
MKALLIVSLTFAGTILMPLAQADDAKLCSIPPSTYPLAKIDYPDYAFAIEQLENLGTATWYTDREIDGDFVGVAERLVEACDNSTRLTAVVYGLPNKDCEAGYSSGGNVTNAAEYEAFISSLADVVGDRKALFILEPDAVGLLGNGVDSCAEKFGYRANLKTAIQHLSANPNADIYVDVGFWRLADPGQAAHIAEIVRDISNAGRVKGITLNTSNYQGTNAMVQMCNNFQTAYGSKDLGCIIDTSRNYNAYNGSEWCNVRSGGIGHPPTSKTGIDNIDYFVWVKPPGESDGECDGDDHTSDAMVGPEAGLFFPEEFELLWDQGYFVQEEGMATLRVDEAKKSGSNTSAGVIVVICLVVVGTVLACGFWFLRRRRAQLEKPLGTNFKAIITPTPHRDSLRSLESVRKDLHRGSIAHCASEPPIETRRTVEE